ncbi:NlpC/P60 family protein [Hathewaya massiliensis]|uniref:C40 family peptidase n=1 Tax=Hathewaya massiliensis TaxID=1964382 RepID=UPI001A9B4C0E|nr:C40 family peptidase [Hathewaya massiliensis]
MNKKILSIVVVATIISTLSTPVFANPAQNSSNNGTQKISKINIENNKAEYEKAIKEVQSLETEIEKFDSKIQDMIIKIDQANNSIELTNEKMAKSRSQIEKAKAEISAEQEVFQKRAKSLYMNGTDNYIEIILESKGVHDFIARIENVRSIVKLDREVMGKLREKQEIIELNQKKLEEDKNNLIILKSTIEKDLTEVKRSKALQEPLIKEANKKKDMYGDIISQYQAQLAENQRKIEEENKRLKEVAKNQNASNTSTSSNNREDSSSRSNAVKDNVGKSTSNNNQNSSNTKGSSSNQNSNNNSSSDGTSLNNNGSSNNSKPKPKPQVEKEKPSRGDGKVPSSGGLGQSAVREALKYQGIPYLWGGTTPSGFDCSGLMQYVYRSLGVDIGRSTYDQIYSGYSVSKSDLQPGDLVFFGSASAPHHVGMYIGGGQYVHAPRTGDVVKISSLGYRGDYCGARRIGN